MKKIILFVSLFIVLLVVGGATWAYFAFLYTKPLNKAELAELTPDWSVVTHGNWSPWFTEADGTQTWNPAASFNAWLATVPEEDKAWPAIIKANYAFVDVLSHDLYLEYIGAIPTHHERWALLEELLSSVRSDELVQVLHEAYARPVLGCDLLESTDTYEHAELVAAGIEDEFWDPAPFQDVTMMDVQLVWLGRQKGQMNFMSGMALYEIEQGRVDSFLEIIETMARSSRLCREYPILISQLVEMAIDSLTQSTISWALDHHPELFGESHLARLDSVLVSHSEFRFIPEGEMVASYDTIRRMVNEKGKLSFGAGATGGPANSDSYDTFNPRAQQMLMAMHLTYQQAELLSVLPWDEQAESIMSVLERQKAKSNFIVASMIDILVPAFDHAASRFRLQHQQIIGMRVGIAVHRHRLRHGEFPESLSAIDPDLLKVDPIDAYTGKQLGYVLNESGPVIYSVGDDRIDDHGQNRWRMEEVGMLGAEAQIRVRKWPDWISKQEASNRMKTDPDSISGDWVLFPMPENEPAPIDDMDEDWDLQQPADD